MKTDKTILVVEDNDVAREGLAAILSHAGYSVDAAANGKEALDRLQTERPGLILLDMLMPVLDGWQFLNVLQKSAIDVPVVVTTGTILNRDWALQHGCCGFVRKPIDTDELLSEVQRCMP